MNILSISSAEQATELGDKFGSSHSYQRASSWQQATSSLPSVDVVFDFTNAPDVIHYPLIDLKGRIVFVNTAYGSLHRSLEGLENETIKGITFIGFCGMPSFLKRDLFEVCLHHNSDEDVLKEVCKKLKTDFVRVKDDVGFITPRVICMIINEAYFTAEEGTATRSDIDLAMKLGTNYPYGPFEWCDKIGLENVYKILEAMHQSTNDDRYKICPLLKQEYQKFIA